MNEFQDIFDRVEDISEEINYWFVRTDGGDNFDVFLKEGVIGIGWNAITLHDINTKSIIELKAKIAQVEGINQELSKGKGSVTRIYNKIKRFQELEKGDVVVIPSRNSSRLAFGTIEDAGIETETSEAKLQELEYYKRRKVKWHRVVQSIHLDPVFYQLTATQHAISNIKKYDKFIDREISMVYTKNDYSHLTLEVRKKDKIDVVSLVTFIKAIQDLVEAINIEFQFGEDTASNSIRLNIQSPGTIELILKKGKSLILLGALLGFISCENPDDSNMTDEAQEEMSEFVEVNEDLVNSVRQGMIELEMNKDRINNLYNKNPHEDEEINE